MVRVLEYLARVGRALVGRDLLVVLVMQHPVARVVVVALRLLATEALRQAWVGRDIRGSTAVSTVEAAVPRMAAFLARQGVRVVVVLGLFLPELRGLQTQVAVVAVVGLIREAPAVTAVPALS